MARHAKADSDARQGETGSDDAFAAVRAALLAEPGTSEGTAAGGAERLRMGKRTMREWVSVDRSHRDWAALAREALAFARVSASPPSGHEGARSARQPSNENASRQTSSSPEPPASITGGSSSTSCAGDASGRASTSSSSWARPSSSDRSRRSTSPSV